MGNYTELRVRAIVKPKYRALIEGVMTTKGTMHCWKAAAAEFPGLTWLENWAGVSRSMMIPFGGSCYFDEHPAWPRVFRPDDGFWQFRCDLKNYDSTIEYFLGHVLPELAESVTEAWEHYEEDDHARRVGVACRA